MATTFNEDSWLLAWVSLGARNVSSGQHSLFSSLPFHQFLHLFLFQTQASCYFAISFSLIMTLFHNFSQLLDLCILSCRKRQPSPRIARAQKSCKNTPKP